MSFEDELETAGREEQDRKVERYRCDRCGSVEVVATHGEDPSCPRCGNRLTREP